MNLVTKEKELWIEDAAVQLRKPQKSLLSNYSSCSLNFLPSSVEVDVSLSDVTEESITDADVEADQITDSEIKTVGPYECLLLHAKQEAAVPVRLPSAFPSTVAFVCIEGSPVATAAGLEVAGTVVSKEKDIVFARVFNAGVDTVRILPERPLFTVQPVSVLEGMYWTQEGVH